MSPQRLQLPRKHKQHFERKCNPSDPKGASTSLAVDVQSRNSTSDESNYWRSRRYSWCRSGPESISCNITPCFRCNNQLIDKLFCWAKNKRTILDVLDVFLDFLFKQHMGSNVFLVVWRRIQIPRVWYCSIKSIGTLAPWHHHWEYKLNVWWGCRCESTAGSKEKAKVLSMKHFLQTENNIPTTS